MFIKANCVEPRDIVFSLLFICDWIAPVTPLRCPNSALKTLFILPNNFILPIISSFSDGSVVPIPTFPLFLITITFEELFPNSAIFPPTIFVALRAASTKDSLTTSIFCPE